MPALYKKELKELDAAAKRCDKRLRHLQALANKHDLSDEEKRQRVRDLRREHAERARILIAESRREGAA